MPEHLSETALSSQSGDAAEIITIPCLRDNYAYILRVEGVTALVDVPEAEPVLRALQKRGWGLDLILLTHHHDDHIAGVPLVRAETGARVLGAKADAHRLPPLDSALTPGDVFDIGPLQVSVLDAPGHTLGHIAFHIPKANALFTGDSLMSWGCGRLFEGTPAQMLETLARLGALPDTTEVYSGHEYTESNGRFALSLEPDNPALNARMADVRSRRAQGLPTVPASLQLEHDTNPFLRALSASQAPALIQALGLPDTASPLDIFTEARARKDRY